MKEETFLAYEEIVYGVMKKIGISSHHRDYEDLLQIGRLLLWELLLAHKPLNSQNDYSLRGFLFNHLHWRLLDELRKQSRRHNDELVTEEFQQPDHNSEERYEEVILIQDMMKKMWPLFTQNEKNYFKETFFYQQSAHEIAKKYHVSRRSVYRWRNNVSLKIAKYFLI